MCALTDFEGYSESINYLCKQGVCAKCDTRRGELIAITQETALDLLRNYTVYFETKDQQIGFVSWWSKVDGHYHNIPEMTTYFGENQSVKRIIAEREKENAPLARRGDALAEDFERVGSGFARFARNAETPPPSASTEGLKQTRLKVSRAVTAESSTRTVATLPLQSTFL